MDILNKIASHKKKVVEEKKSLYPVKLLEKSIYFQTQTVSLKEYIRRGDKSGIIAEFKTQSPSKGTINKYADIEKVTIGYMQAGASALSVLTDTKYFGGNIKNLIRARQMNYCPVLQKDFIIDEYQIIEAKSAGADAILLIAAIHTKDSIRNLARFAKSLQLEIILEIHDESELGHLIPEVDILGVNNRNLKTFKTSINQSLKLIEYLPKNILKISESAISNTTDIHRLKNAGYEGFLIGELFMKTQNPAVTCKDFICRLKKTKHKHMEEVHYES